MGDCFDPCWGQDELGGPSGTYSESLVKFQEELAEKWRFEENVMDTKTAKLMDNSHIYIRIEPFLWFVEEFCKNNLDSTSQDQCFHISTVIFKLGHEIFFR